MMQVILLAGYPWVTFHPLMSSFLFHLLYWLAFATAIYAVFFYIKYFREAKKREVLEEHTGHMVVSLLLLLLTFFKFTAMLCILPALIAGTILYPVAFLDNREAYKDKFRKNKYAYWIVHLLALIITYYLTKYWTCVLFDFKIIRFILPFFLTALNVFGGVMLAMAFNTCPKCGYYCQTKTVRTDNLGTTYGQDVTNTITKSYDKDRSYYEYGVLYHYQKIDTSQSTDHFRVDHYRSICYCPHCQNTWTARYSTKNYYKRIRENLGSKSVYTGSSVIHGRK